MLTNVATFEVAVGATVLAVKFQDEDGYQQQNISIELYLAIA